MTDAFYRWLAQAAIDGYDILPPPTPTRETVLKPYADYLADLGLDCHSVNVVRDGGYHDLNLRFVPRWDTWTAIRVSKILRELEPASA